jgi:hypothetical protein
MLAITSANPHSSNPINYSQLINPRFSTVLFFINPDIGGAC